MPSKFKKTRAKEDVKSVEPPTEFLQHPGLTGGGTSNKSTDRRSGGVDQGKNESSESNSNDNKSSQEKLKGLRQGSIENKLMTKAALISSKGLREIKPSGIIGKTKHFKYLKSQGSLIVVKKPHKKSTLLAA